MRAMTSLYVGGVVGVSGSTTSRTRVPGNVNGSSNVTLWVSVPVPVTTYVLLLFASRPPACPVADGDVVYLDRDGPALPGGAGCAGAKQRRKGQGCAKGIVRTAEEYPHGRPAQPPRG